MPITLTPHDAALIAAQVRRGASGTKDDVLALVKMIAASETTWTDADRKFVAGAVWATVIVRADLFDEIGEMFTAARRMAASKMPDMPFSAN